MEFVELEHFAVMGIEVRTSNARELTPEGLIAGHWERFMKEGIAARIPHKIDANILAVYSDYAGDEHGEYSLLLGAKVSAINEVPPGMTVRNTPTGRYAIFTSERGPIPKIVYEMWKRIWAEPPRANYKRNFRADFEVYGERARNPADSQIEIYVGVNSAQA